MAEITALITQCPECSLDMDVSGLPPFSMASCPGCQHQSRVRTRLGQYEINGLIGEGGMSQVFAAKDVTLQRTVALKILHQQLSQDKKLTTMFEREARLTASISHPNVVKVYTVGEENGYFYIAMELLDAVSIEEIIIEGALGEDDVLHIAYDVVSGLKAAYSSNLIHRDIKPGNILQTKNNTAKLVDFGLAVAQGGADENEDLWATPFYVPPEKLVRKPDTYLGDIYALGATCYHAVAGEPPFAANTSSLDELIQIKSSDLDLKSVTPHVSEPTIRLIEQMMAYQPDDRPASYDKLLERIEFCQQSRRSQPSKSISNRAVETKKDNKNQVYAIVAAVGVVLLAVVVLLLNKSGEKDEVVIVANSVEAVIDADEDLSKKFKQANRELSRGNTRKASKLLTALSENEEFAQPRRSWAVFLNGIAALLEEDSDLAFSRFKLLDVQEGVSEDYKAFFDRTKELMTDFEPLYRETFNFKKDSYEIISLLAVGLDNWQQGEFEEAVGYFEEFEKQPTPKDYLWIDDLKRLVKRFKDDYTIVQTIPQPKRRMSHEKLSEIVLSVELAKNEVQTKKMHEVLDGIYERSLLVKSLNLKPERESSDFPVTEQEKSDLSLIQNWVSTTPNQSGVSELAKLKLATQKGKELQKLLLDGSLLADKFLMMVMEYFNETQYDGEIVQRAGAVLSGTIIAASENEVTVDLGFGPNQVSISNLDLQWLSETAIALIPEPSLSSIEDWKVAFWYVTFGNFKEEAESIGSKIEAYDSEFKSIRSTLSKLQF